MRNSTNILLLQDPKLILNCSIDTRQHSYIFRPSRSEYLPWPGKIWAWKMDSGYGERRKLNEVSRYIYEGKSDLPWTEVSLHLDHAIDLSKLMRWWWLSLAYLELYLSIAYLIRRFNFDVSATKPENITVTREKVLGYPEEGRIEIFAKVDSEVSE
jgi:hypothetical protein